MGDGAKTDLIISPEAFVVDALVLACSALSDINYILNFNLNFAENALTSNVQLKELGICSETVLRLVKHTDDEIKQTMIQAMLSQHELRQEKEQDELLQIEKDELQNKTNGCVCILM